MDPAWIALDKRGRSQKYITVVVGIAKRDTFMCTYVVYENQEKGLENELVEVELDILWILDVRDSISFFFIGR